MSDSASGSTINIKTEIIRLVENQGEKAELLSYFTKHKDQQDDALSDLICFDTNESKLAYLRNFLKPEQPVAASVGNLSNLFGQMNLSGSSSSENESASPFTFFTELVRVVREDSEETRKVIKANTEVMIRLGRNTPGQSHETGSMTRARAYQNTSFRTVDQEYFLSKTRSRLDQLGKIGRYRNIENYIRDYPAPTASEEEVQDWFNTLTKALPAFSSQLAVKDTHTNTYLEGYNPDFSILLNEDAVNNVYIPTFVCTLLEVKKRKSPNSGLTDDFNKTL